MAKSDNIKTNSKNQKTSIENSIDAKQDVNKKSTFFTRDKIALVYYFFFACFIDVLFFIVMEWGAIPRYPLFDFVVILMILGLVYAIPNYYVQCSVALVALLFQCTLCITNIIILKTAYEIFSFSMLGQAGDGFRAFDFSIMDIVGLSLFAVMICIIIGVFVFIIAKKLPKPKYTGRKVALMLAIFTCWQGLGGLTYYLQYRLLSDTAQSSETYMFESDKYLYDHHQFKTEAMKSFGLLGFYVKDIGMILAGDEISESEAKNVAEYFASGTKELTDLTGVSSGNDVITILMETFEYFAIDEHFTPTLYRLFYEDGVTLQNFYANNRTNISEGLVLVGNYVKENPILSASDTSLNTLSNPYYGMSLPKRLGDDYYSTYMHTYTSYFYNRYITHTKDYVGFDKLLTLEKMTKLDDYEDYGNSGSANFYKWYNWQLDSDVVDKYKEEIFPVDKKYYTHFSTMITHGKHMQRECLQPYYDILTADMLNEDNTFKTEGNFYNLTQSLIRQGYTLPVDNDEMMYRFLWYKSAAMDLDKTIQTMLDYLQSTGRLDSTTILLFADHNAYYNDLTYAMKDIEKTAINAGNVELYHIPCVIYDNKLKNKLNTLTEMRASLNISKNNIGDGYMVKHFASTFNLMPTLCDVLGLDYNPNFYMGSSIFNPKSMTEIFQSNIAGTPYFNDRLYVVYNGILYRRAGVTSTEIEQFKSSAVDLYVKNMYLEKLYKNPTRVMQEYGKLRNS